MSTGSERLRRRQEESEGALPKTMLRMMGLESSFCVMTKPTVFAILLSLTVPDHLAMLWLDDAAAAISRQVCLFRLVSSQPGLNFATELLNERQHRPCLLTAIELALHSSSLELPSLDNGVSNNGPDDFKVPALTKVHKKETQPPANLFRPFHDDAVKREQQRDSCSSWWWWTHATRGFRCVHVCTPSRCIALGDTVQQQQQQQHGRRRWINKRYRGSVGDAWRTGRHWDSGSCGFGETFC